MILKYSQFLKDNYLFSSEDTLDELNNFIDSLLFLSKQQERFNQISNKTDQVEFT